MSKFKLKAARVRRTTGANGTKYVRVDFPVQDSADADVSFLFNLEDTISVCVTVPLDAGLLQYWEHDLDSFADARDSALYHLGELLDFAKHEPSLPVDIELLARDITRANNLIKENDLTFERHYHILHDDWAQNIRMTINASGILYSNQSGGNLVDMAFVVKSALEGKLWSGYRNGA